MTRRSGGPPAGQSPRTDPSPLDVAARILQRAALTENALRERLIARGYQPDTAERTVARCRELGYVDDGRLAADRARALRARGAGSLKIADDLRARGLPEALIDAAVAASREGRSETDWARRALASADGLQRARAWRLLVARGFDLEIVADVLGGPD